MGGIISYFASFFRKKDPRTPVKGIGVRLKNIGKNNFRGIIGSILPLCVLSWQSEKDNHRVTVELMWMWMIWFFIWQPVSVPVVGLIPIFLLPMTGVMSSLATCQCYMNENVLLYILTGMLIVLLNNSGVDRRIALWFICSGDSCQFSGKRLILKVSTAAFFLSMFSSRLITTSIITQYMTPPLMQLQSVTAKGAGPDFNEMRYIINNAIQTASGIGSTAIFHSSYATVLFRAVFQESAPIGKELPDIFNYLQYSAFAFPVAFLMFVFNFSYHMMLINWCIDSPMNTASMTEMRRLLLKHKAELPRRVTLHEKLSVISTIIYLCMLFFRWNHWISGWADFSKADNSPEIPQVKDATTAAIFLIVLHIIPKGYGFLKFLDAEKKSQLPPLKPESAILWWRFVDKNINYGYFFMFGAGISVMTAAKMTGLDVLIADNFGKEFTTRPWTPAMFVICFVTSLLANVTTAMAACSIFLPFILCIAHGSQIPWPAKHYVPSLGVGIASSFGFCFPFQYTPAYFCHYTGKVPMRKMLKYSFCSVWICIVTLWIALLIWAPYLFDPGDFGIVAVDAPVPAGATPAPAPEGGGR